jgi:hypothetical protein
MGTRLTAAIAAKKLDEFGNITPAYCYLMQPVKSRASANKCKQTLTGDNDITDTEGNEFATSATEDGSDEDSDAVLISNKEVCHV